MGVEAEVVWKRHWLTRFGHHHGNEVINYKSKVLPSRFVTQAASHTLLASIPFCVATVTAASSSASNIVRTQLKVVSVTSVRFSDKKHL